MLKNYLFDVLVWAVIAAVVGIPAFAFIKSKRAFLFVMGALLVLGAVPAGIMLELSANGCCGQPDTGHRGIGYILMVVMAVAGCGLFWLAARKKN